VVKTDSNGNIQWIKNVAIQRAYTIVATNDGGFAFSGDRLLKTDSLGNTQWSLTEDSRTVEVLIETTDGGFVWCGYDANHNFWIGKTDSKGTYAVPIDVEVHGGTTPFPNFLGASPWPTQTPKPIPTPTPIITASPSTPTPTFPPRKTSTLQLSFSTNTTNSQVNICGNIVAEGREIPSAYVRISYSVNDGTLWSDLILVNTNSSGQVKIPWAPYATGNYLVKAAYDGNSEVLPTSTTANLVITLCSTQNALLVASNSTLSQLSLDSAAKHLSFKVTGKSGTTGYLEMCLPKSLIADISKLAVSIDEKPAMYGVQLVEDSWLVSFTYHHSTHQIDVNMQQSAAPSPALARPEFSALVSCAALVAIVVIAIAATVKKKKRINSQPPRM
jgi:hypothetical protein